MCAAILRGRSRTERPAFQTAQHFRQSHYLDPKTGILSKELEQPEASFVTWRSYELSQRPLAGRFDLAHLQACRPTAGGLP